MAANSNCCQWWSGCAEPIWSSGGPIPLCERHCAEFKKTDHDRVMDVLKEIRDDLKTLLARQR
jgi:hypothetical protein